MLYLYRNQINNNLMNKYMLLSRLIADCKYYLGHGNGNEKALWTGNVKLQIHEMKKLFDSMEDKPVWTSIEEINGLQKSMESLKERKGIIDSVYELLVKHSKETNKDFYAEQSISYPRRGQDFDTIILGEFSEKIILFYFYDPSCIVILDEEYYLNIIASNPTLSVLDAFKKNKCMLFEDISKDTIEDTVNKICIVIEENVFG